MKRTLPSLAIAALFIGGCPTPPNNNNQETCVEDPTICGAGTVCDEASATCVAADCNDDASLCNANETCNAATGECDPIVVVQSCTSIDGSTTIEPSKVDVEFPGSASFTADLTAVQFGAEGDSADAVFQVTLPEKSDLIIKTLVPQGQTAQDTIITVRSLSCDGDIVATVDNINVDNGQAAVLNARSLDAGDYFVFVDSKSTAPITAPVQLEIFRTAIVSEGLGCVAGLGTQRCDDGLTCLSPAASANLESFNSCEAFSINDTRVFLGDDTGKLYEINPANGTVIDEGDITTPSGRIIPVSGTGHYALAYDDISHKLFWHDNQSTQIDDDEVDGTLNGLSPDIKSEVLLFDAEDFTRLSQWGTAGIGNNSLGQPFKIEGLAFNRNASANQQISAFDATAGEVTVVDPANGNFAFDYGAASAPSVLFAGFGVDGFNTEPQFNTAGRGYITRSDDNQLQEFRLGVGTFIRTVAAPPQVGTQCGVGSKGNFVFVGYTDGLVRVLTAVNDVFPGLPEGSFVTEYRAPGLNACAIDAGGL